MKREEQIDKIVEFIFDKDKVMVVPDLDDTFEFFSIDYVAKGTVATKPCIVATKEAQIELYKEIALALITNKKSYPFSGMGGRWNQKRAEEGIIFGNNGIGMTNKYPIGTEYEYTLMAWVK